MIIFIYLKIYGEWRSHGGGGKDNIKIESRITFPFA